MVSSSTPNTRSPRILRSSISSASTSARAAASVSRLRRDAHDEPLDAAGEERDGRIAVCASSASRRCATISRERRLRRSPRLQRPRHDRRRARPTARSRSGSTWSVIISLHLVRHAGHRVHDLAGPDVSPSAHEAGRGPDRVRDRLAAVGDVGLAQVVLRHVAQPRRGTSSRSCSASSIAPHELAHPSARRSRRGSGRPGSDRDRRTR